MMELIKSALTDSAITPEKLHGLLDFKERLDAKADQAEANAAFARVVKNMPIIRRNGAIDFSSEKKGKQKPIFYAKFEDIQEAIRPIYEAEGFVVTYDSEPQDNTWTRWYAIATHSTGVQFKASVSLPLDTSGGKQNVQAGGSTASYGMRYATKALFALRFEGEDDDGVKAGISYITLEQMKEINALIADTKTDVTRFLRTFEVAEVQNLHTSQFPVAKNLLLAKKGKAQ